jgi:hypothetical protein
MGVMITELSRRASNTFGQTSVFRCSATHLHPCETAVYKLLYINCFLPLLLSVHSAFTLKVSFSEAMLETIWIAGCGVRILWRGLCFAKLILMFITYGRLPHMVEATVHKGFMLLIKCTLRPNDHQCGAKMIPSFFWQRVKLPNLSVVHFHPVIYLTHSYQHLTLACSPRRGKKKGRNIIILVKNY